MDGSNRSGVWSAAIIARIGERFQGDRIGQVFRVSVALGGKVKERDEPGKLRGSKSRREQREDKRPGVKVTQEATSEPVRGSARETVLLR